MSAIDSLKLSIVQGMCHRFGIEFGPVMGMATLCACALRTLYPPLDSEESEPHMRGPAEEMSLRRR